MPINTPSNKGTSPSPNIQRGVDTAWGSQQGTTDPKQALAGKHNEKPVPVSGQK